MSKTKEEITIYALSRPGVLVVGVAAVEEINKYTPKGYRPNDILPGAKSVVVLGGPLPTRGSWRTPPKYLPEAGPNADAIAARAYGLSYFIEDKFDVEAVLTVGFPSTGGRYGGAVPWQSLKLHAELAGLGQRSMMGGIILHPEYGFMYYASVITTLDLEPDGPIKQKVCPDESCIRMYERKGQTPCMKGCPFGCFSGEIENGEIKVMRYNRYKCLAVSMRDRQHGVFIKKAIEKALEGKYAEMKQILYGEEFGNAQLMLAYGSQRYFGNCWECVRSCPVVMRGAKNLAEVKK
jgi:epoxyqueuosine reductase QueG